MKKEFVENKKKELLNEIVASKKRMLEIIDIIANNVIEQEDKLNFIKSLKKDIEKNKWSFLHTTIDLLKSVIGVFGLKEEEKYENEILINELSILVNNAYKNNSLILRYSQVIDKGPLIVKNKNIVITDPCYLMKKRDDSNKPKWEDYHPYKDIREYPDFDEKTYFSKMFNENDKKLSVAYEKWESANPDDWDICEYGERLDKLGFKNYLVADTIYGDWGCTTFDVDTKEKIGEFCADAGMVCVCVLDEVNAYNSKFIEWAKEHSWTTTIIEDFSGEIWIKIDENNEDNEDYEEFVVYIEGQGNKNFKTSQTSL